MYLPDVGSEEGGEEIRGERSGGGNHNYKGAAEAAEDTEREGAALAAAGAALVLSEDRLVCGWGVTRSESVTGRRP